MRLELVVDVEEEEAQPVPKDDEGSTCEDGKESWGGVSGENGAGKGAGEAEQGFGDDYRFDVAGGEEPESVDVEGPGSGLRERVGEWMEYGMSRHTWVLGFLSISLEDVIWGSIFSITELECGRLGLKVFEDQVSYLKVAAQLSIQGIINKSNK